MSNMAIQYDLLFQQEIHMCDIEGPLLVTRRLFRTLREIRSDNGTVGTAYYKKNRVVIEAPTYEMWHVKQSYQANYVSMDDGVIYRFSIKLEIGILSSRY